jgi:ribosome-associated protein
MRFVAFLLSLLALVAQPAAAASSPSLTSLEQQLSSLVSNKSADVGIAALDLNTGEMVSMKGDTPFPMASTVKVAIAALYLSQVDHGQKSLDDDQAIEVVSIPLAGKSNIADHMVVASGRSTRQVASMAVKLGEKIKERFGKIVRIEGLPAADWVLIDADDVIVHLFRPEVRTFYNLERMWAFGDDATVSAAQG